MNINDFRAQVFRTVCAGTVIAGTLVATATPGIAAEPRAQAESVSTDSSYAYVEAFAALDGRTIAEYLSDHWARKVRTHV
jgi:hypothetical protein